jgi:hypothetical protein
MQWTIGIKPSAPSAASGVEPTRRG